MNPHFFLSLTLRRNKNLKTEISTASSLSGRWTCGSVTANFDTPEVVLPETQGLVCWALCPGPPPASQLLSESEKGETEEEPDEVWQRRDRDQVWHVLSVKASLSPEISSNGLRDVQISPVVPCAVYSIRSESQNSQKSLFPLTQPLLSFISPFKYDLKELCKPTHEVIVQRDQVKGH